MPKRSIPVLVTIGLLGLSLAFTLNILDPFIYSEKVRLLAPPALKNTVLGFIPITALGVALIIQPLAGRWSDRTRSRWGKRAPYLVAGVTGVILSLAFVVAADSLWLLVAAAMVFSASLNTMQGAWQALIPDQVPESQRGLAAGIKTLLEIIGTVAGIAIILQTLARGNLWAAPLLAIGLFGLILLITLHTLRRSPAGHPPIHPASPVGPKQPQPQPGFWLLQSGLARLEHVPGLRWWMLNRFLFWAAAIAIRTFSLNYMQDVLSLSLAEAQVLSNRLLLVVGLGIFLLALPAGAMADRVGRQPLLAAAGLVAAGGASLFIFVRDINVLFIAGGLIAGGTGLFVSTSWALATDLVPPAEGALYLGLANAASVLGSIGGRLGGPLIDGLNHFTGSATIGYLAIFGLAACFFAGSSAVVLRINQALKQAGEPAE